MKLFAKDLNESSFLKEINGLSSASVTTSLLSIGILFSIVSTLFFGIKLKWFRYRMNFPNEQENPVMLRAHSVTEIRENCSVGCYRQSLQEDTLIRIDNESRSTTPPSSSSDNVKSKSKCLSNYNTFHIFFYQADLPSSKCLREKMCVNQIFLISFFFVFVY